MSAGRDPSARAGEGGRRDDSPIVYSPSQLPDLSVGASRALLAILVELTTVEILDGPSEGVHDGC